MLASAVSLVQNRRRARPGAHQASPRSAPENTDGRGERVRVDSVARRSLWR